MPQRLYGYLKSSREFMARQLAALESGRVRLVTCPVEPETDVSHLAIAQLREELEKVDHLIKIYGVS